jgi:hypothetical protein
MFKIPIYSEIYIQINTKPKTDNTTLKVVLSGDIATSATFVFNKKV